MNILVPISPGELLDKITILEIKLARMTDAAKLANVRAELNALAAVEAKLPESVTVLPALRQSLREINETLWQIEDDIRDCERAQDFGARFIDLARAVYHTNDRRAAVKREVNVALGSALVEEKSYAAY